MGITRRHRFAFGGLALLAAASLLAACGGGSSGTSSATGVTRGPITGFGSVFINGTEYFTDNSTIRRHVDEGNSDISGLDNDVFRIGMVVELHHGADDNDATEIDYRNNLEGPVAGLTAGGFSVLGIPVTYDNSTNIRLEGGATLADGAIVEVSGLPDSAGVLNATYIEVKPAGSVSRFEVKGFVVANNIAADNSFTLGLVAGAASTTTVQVNGATRFDLPGGSAGLTAGTFVEVKTASTAAPILATSVEAQGPETECPEGSRVSIEGFPTDINATAKTFTLMGVSVDASGAVTYEAPLTGFADITGTRKIEVHGTMSGGVLIASRISRG